MRFSALRHSRRLSEPARRRAPHVSRPGCSFPSGRCRVITVLIVAGIRLYREGLAQMLGRESGLTVVGVKSDRRQATADLLELAPDVVIVDMATAESDATVRDVKRVAP